MKKLITIISLVYFLFVALIGVGMSMHMHQSETMDSCYFMQEDPSVCPMTDSNHVAGLRSLFSGIVKSEAIKTIVAISLFIVLLLPFKDLSLRRQIKFKFFEKQNFVLKISDHLFAELYRGILNPKLH